MVLRSGLSFLTRTRPVLSVEYGHPAYSVYGHQPGDLFEFAATQQYALHDLFMNPVADLDEWLAIVDQATWDFFLVPREKTPLTLDYDRSASRTPAAEPAASVAGPPPEDRAPVSDNWSTLRRVLDRLTPGRSRRL
jgi:hypothetical protein